MDVSVLAVAEAGGAEPASVLATDGCFMAWASGQGAAVEVASLTDLAQPSVSLEHDAGKVTALALGCAVVGSSDPTSLANCPQPILVVATQRAVILWRLAAHFAGAGASSAHSPPLVLARDVGYVERMVICERGNRLAVCAGAVVHVYALENLQHDLRLEGHQAPVLAAAFCSPHQPHWLITAGEDRTFALWDLEEATLLYQSPVLTASALLSVSIDPCAFRCVIGAADGVLRFFDLDSLPACRCLQVVDTAKLVGKCVTAANEHAAAATAPAARSAPRIVRAGASGARPPQPSQPPLQAEPSEPLVLCSDAVMILCYLPPDRHYMGHSAHVADPLLGESSKLLVGCMRGLCLLDTHSYSLVQISFYTGAGVALGPLKSQPLVTEDHTRICALRDVEVPSAYACVTPGTPASTMAGSGAAGEGALLCCASAVGPEVCALVVTPVQPAISASPDTHTARHYEAGLSEGLYKHSSVHSTHTNNTDTHNTDTNHITSGGGVSAASGVGRHKEESNAPHGPGPPTRPLSVYMTAPLPANSPLLGSMRNRRPSSSLGPPAPSTHSNGLPASQGGSSNRGIARSLSAGAVATHNTPAANSDRSSAGAARAGWSTNAQRNSNGSNNTNGSNGQKLPPIQGALRRANSTNSTGQPSKPKLKPLQDQRIVFHKQIKSSGYGFLQPQVKVGQMPPRPVKLDPKPKPVNLVAKHLLAARQYPVDSGPPVRLIPPHTHSHTLTGCADSPAAVTGAAPSTRMSDYRVHRAAVLGLKYSGDGSRLLTCSADKTARMLKVPLDKGQGGTDLLGHNGAITCGDWSQDSTMVLTASADRTARLWLAGCAQPALEFTGTVQQSGLLGAASKGPSVPDAAPASPAKTVIPSRPGSKGRSGVTPSPFLNEVTTARFFYLDRFVMLATGNKLHIFEYQLFDGDPTDDLSRLRNNNTYQLITTWTSTAQAINTFAAVNTFHSPIVLLAASNRSIEILDCTTMQLAASIPNAHTRPTHTIIQSAGTSMFTSHPRDANELFATAATDGLAKLWDVRTCRCVRSFSGHTNTQIPVGLAFCPSLRYLACGSEDQAVHMYDVRQGQLVHRLREPQGDVITALAFHPLVPQLAAGNLAGGVRFYGV